jgi:hypothetical protein
MRPVEANYWESRQCTRQKKRRANFWESRTCAHARATQHRSTCAEYTKWVAYKKGKIKKNYTCGEYTRWVAWVQILQGQFHSIFTIQSHKKCVPHFFKSTILRMLHRKKVWHTFWKSQCPNILTIKPQTSVTHTFLKTCAHFRECCIANWSCLVLVLSCLRSSPAFTIIIND